MTEDIGNRLVGMTGYFRVGMVKGDVLGLVGEDFPGKTW